MKKGLKWIYQILISRGLAVGLFGAVCLFAIPGTFIEKKEIYSNPIFVIIFGLIGLNLSLCTLRKIRILLKSILIMHIGVILTLIGSVISSFGFIATVNIYEGTIVDKAYRWDINKEIPLGAELTVKKINREFYPIPLKVGVIKGEEKVGLFILKTGEAFDLGKYRIMADDLELPSENLRLSIFNEGHFIGYFNTSGEKYIPSDFPYEFRLVAYKNPSLKRVWVDLSLSRGSEILAEGTSEVNNPFKWQGLYFYHTSVERDPYGMPFAGIQITRDPGRPYVFLGFTVMGIGSIMYFLRRLSGTKK